MTPWTLAPAGVAAGALMLFVFRRTTDAQSLRTTINRIQAHLLEFWLFVDEPSAVWKSWKGLLAANARFLRLLLVPIAVLTVPMIPLFFCLDAFYGSSPLMLGKPALVTAGFDQPLDRLTLPLLKAPDGMSVEGQPVRVFGKREVSWRVRPAKPLSGKLQLGVAGRSIEKSVEAGGGWRYLSQRRTRSLVELVRYPTEMPLREGPVAWIEVAYPPAAVPLFGTKAHWSVWFLVFSLAGAILETGVRKCFGS